MSPAPPSLQGPLKQPTQLSWAAALCGTAGPHLQGGELAHVGEGGVAQGADLVVAQIAGKQKPQGLEPAGPCPLLLLPSLLSCNGVQTAAGLSHRAIAAMCCHAWHQVVTSQRLSIAASQLCSRAEAGHRGMSGVPAHCQTPPQDHTPWRQPLPSPTSSSSASSCLGSCSWLLTQAADT